MKPDIDPTILLRGPEVDRILSITDTTRWRLTRRGLLPARRPLGPGTQPRYLGADVLALRDAT
jgi:predicted DNA-binding transcriptional regulator AlpA